MRDLIDQLEALANEGEPRGAGRVFRAAQAAARGLPVRHGGRSKRWIAVAFAILLLVVGAVSVLVATTDPNTSSVRTGPADAPTQAPDGDPGEIVRLFNTLDEAPVGPGPLYLVPESVPEGLTLLRASGGNDLERDLGRGGSPSIERQQTWVHVRRGAPNPLIDFLTVSWSGPQPAGAQLFGGSDAVPVTVQGRPGLASGDVVEWQDSDGRVVAVMAALGRDALVAVSEGVTRQPDGGFTLSSPPDGYALAYESPGMASDGTNPRELVYSDGAGRGLRIYITTGTENPPGLVLRSPPPVRTSGGPPFVVRVDDVRGRPALVGNAGLNGGGGHDSQTLFLVEPTVALRWLEPQNVSIVVTSVGLTEAETMAAARELRQVDQREWDELVARAPGRSGAAPVPAGPPPTFTGIEAEIERAFLAWLDADSIQEVMQAIEGGAEIRSAIEAAEAQAAVPRTRYSGTVDAIRFVGEDRALVTYTILQDGRASLPNQQGAAVLLDGRWRVSRQTYCALISIGGIQCPG